MSFFEDGEPQGCTQLTLFASDVTNLPRVQIKFHMRTNLFIKAFLADDELQSEGL